MSSTLYYFLQVILCSGIMVGYYWLVLRNNRFHQYNRFYLLAIALLSWIVPLIKIQWNKPVETDPQLIQFFSVIADNNTEIESGLHKGWLRYGWQGSLLFIYSLVAIILLIGLIKSLFQIYQLLKTHSCKSVGDVFLILTQAKGAPFSFFRYIFWHESIDLKSEAGKQMMQHELAHVQQKHSFDKICIQLVLIAGWFNPFFWAIKKEMEMIHEFIADKKAVANGDSASLAQMLLAAAYPQQQYLLTNPFFFSPIKRRLAMITKNANPKYSYMRRLIVLPLLAIVVVLFAFRTKELRNAENISVGTIVAQIGSEAKSILSENNTVANKDQARIIADTTILNADSVYVIPKDKSIQLISEGKNASNFITLNGIALQNKMNFYSKDGSVAVSGDVKRLNYNSTGKDTGFVRFNAINFDTVPPMMLVDGVKMDKSSLSLIDPNFIKEITVLKNKSAVELYGEEGKHGVILVTTKNKAGMPPLMALRLNKIPNDTSKFVQGYPLNSGEGLKMSGYVTVEKEGKINSNKIVETQKNKEIVVQGYKLNSGELSEKPVKVVQGFKINPNPLVIINGKPFYADLNEIKIDPKDIESVNVLSKEGAIKKYGEAAEYGAIEIKAKKIVSDVKLNDVSDPSGIKAFLNRNPAIKKVSWNHNPLRMNLEFKDGSIETYDLTNPSSVQKAMNKYGKLSLPTPPPPPPPGSTGQVNEKFPKVENIYKGSPSQVEESKSYDKVFTKTEVPASFPGGKDAWLKYLQRNLKLDLPVEKGAPPGTYTVIVSFIVASDGGISNVKADNDPGYQTAEEAVRIIVKGPKWAPAKQNGKAVTSQVKQSVTFKISEE
ncbi:MAG: M56 family metallopeptidase [Sphingobacteriia bacterium]